MPDPASAANVPAVQAWQLTDAGTGAKLPGLQSAQAALPGIDVKRPTAQSVHADAPAPLKRPAGQFVQNTSPAFAVNDPALQATQPSPAEGPAEPGAHTVHTAAPASAPIPEGQSAQNTAPGPENMFAGQVVQGASPVVDDVPGWHWPAGTPVGADTGPCNVTSQPTSMTPLLSSRSHALAGACPGTPSASTPSVAVPSARLFQFAELLNVASVR